MNEKGNKCSIRRQEISPVKPCMLNLIKKNMQLSLQMLAVVFLQDFHTHTKRGRNVAKMICYAFFYASEKRHAH